MSARKTRFVVCVFEKETKKWVRTNWIHAYMRDKLYLKNAPTEPKYSTTQEKEIADAALLYARSCFSENQYEIKHT